MRERKLVVGDPSNQLLRSPMFLFQGSHCGGVKHGRGVLVGREGTVIIGTWQRDLLHGAAVVFPPFGGRLHLRYFKGSIDGWVALHYPTLICFLHFPHNKRKELSCVFHFKQQVWFQLKYDFKGEVVDLISAQKGAVTNPPSFCPELEGVYQKMGGQDNTMFTEGVIRHQVIGERLHYLGNCDEENKPGGLGVIYSQKESFRGHFEGGTLDPFGRMLFANGDIYHGGVSRGLFTGNGLYYRPAANTSFALSSEQGQQSTRAHFYGYTLFQMHSLLGKQHPNCQIGTVGDALLQLCNCVQRYYRKDFVGRTLETDNQDEDLHSQFATINSIKKRRSETFSGLSRGRPQLKDTKLKKQTLSTPIQTIKPSSQYQTTKVVENQNQEEAEHKKASPKLMAVKQSSFQKEDQHPRSSPKLLPAKTSSFQQGTNEEITFRLFEVKEPEQEPDVAQFIDSVIEKSCNRRRRRIFIDKEQPLRK